jgi:hypothetical protein
VYYQSDRGGSGEAPETRAETDADSSLEGDSTSRNGSGDSVSEDDRMRHGKGRGKGKGKKKGKSRGKERRHE